MKKGLEKGQAVLIVLVIMAVALGISLVAVSQSSIDVGITTQEQETSRAFNAAEAGIEQALRDIGSIGTDGLQQISVGGIEVGYSAAENNYLEGRYEENQTATVFLGVEETTLTVQWGTADDDRSGGCKNKSGGIASLFISVINENGIAANYGFNDRNCNNLGVTEGGNNFVRANSSSSDYNSQAEITVNSGDSLMRIRPIYNTTTLKVTASNGTLPVQFYTIDSKAQTESLETRAVQVTRTEPAVPGIFDYALFSGTSIIKN